MSITEIAKEADVSISTVSRFFNKPATVTPKVAARIEAALKKTNYAPRIVRPGPKAASRIGIKTGAVALISLAKFTQEQMWQMPVLPVLIGSVQATLQRKQLSLFLGHLDPVGRLPECVTGKRCDGIIFFSKPQDPEIAARFKRQLPDLPAVWCFREHLDSERRFDHIFYDNSAVGGLAAEYFAARGRRRVAVVNTSNDHSAYGERVESFSRRGRELGLEVTVLAADSPGFHKGVFSEMAQKLLRCGTPLDGVFFCVDQDMLGIYIELLTAGYPAQKLDMVGCNADQVALQYIVPRPASIDIKISQIGQMTVDQLLRRINGDSAAAASEIFIKPELIPGER